MGKDCGLLWYYRRMQHYSRSLRYYQMQRSMMLHVLPVVLPERQKPGALEIQRRQVFAIHFPEMADVSLCLKYCIPMSAYSTVNIVWTDAQMMCQERALPQKKYVLWQWSFIDVIISRGFFWAPGYAFTHETRNRYARHYVTFGSYIGLTDIFIVRQFRGRILRLLRWRGGMRIVWVLIWSCRRKKD